MRVYLFLDLDGTLWDHRDVSLMKPPFYNVNSDCIIDSVGDRLCLYNGARDFLRECSRSGVVVSALSWNIYSKARRVLELLGIIRYFDYLFIEYNPFKDIVLEKALKILEKTFGKINDSVIVYVDDRDIHWRYMNRIPYNIVFIHMWRDVRSFKELLEVVKSISS